MKIDGDTIIFKSARKEFAVEQSGEKSNTVRVLHSDELDELKYSTTPTHIRIVCANNPDQMFTRRLTNIMKIGELLGGKIYVFSWSSIEFATWDVDEFYGDSKT